MKTITLNLQQNEVDIFKRLLQEYPKTGNSTAVISLSAYANSVENRERCEMLAEALAETRKEQKAFVMEYITRIHDKVEIKPEEVEPLLQILNDIRMGYHEELEAFFSVNKAADNLTASVIESLIKSQMIIDNAGTFEDMILTQIS